MPAKPPALLYRCVEQTVQDEDGTRKAYGLQVREAGGAGGVLRAVDDVCSGEGEARALEALLTRNRVSLGHILDVVEDWLAER
jgi:hypothetical protein